MADIGHPRVNGWLTAADQAGAGWPGVLLYLNAFLVRAPSKVLMSPSPDLQVVIDGGDRSGRGCSSPRCWCSRSTRHPPIR